MRKYLGLILISLMTISASSCFGLEVVEVDNPLYNYIDEVDPLLDEWKYIIDDWDAKCEVPESDYVRRLDAEACENQIQALVATWDAVSVPDECKDYHLYMRLAMDYDREAFRIMKDSYSLGSSADAGEFDRLRNLVIEIWLMKDKFLLKADDARPDQ